MSDNMTSGKLKNDINEKLRFITFETAKWLMINKNIATRKTYKVYKAKDGSIKAKGIIIKGISKIKMYTSVINKTFSGLL